jgi:hypothetical protein
MRLINSDGQITDARVIAKDGGNAASASVGNSVLMLPLIMVLCVLVGLSLGVSLWALSYADKARMESRLLQVKVEGFENALHARGIDPNPHLPGDLP